MASTEAGAEGKSEVKSQNLESTLEDAQYNMIDCACALMPLPEQLAGLLEEAEAALRLYRNHNLFSADTSKAKRLRDLATNLDKDRRALSRLKQFMDGRMKTWFEELESR